MTAEELFKYLTEGAGLSEEDAAAAMRLAKNQNVSTRAQQLKQQREYDEIASRFSELEKKFDSAKTYAEWYAKYGDVIRQNEQMLTRYIERYGSLDTPTTTTTSGGTNNVPTGNFTMADVQKMAEELVDKKLGGTHDRLGSLLVQFGEVVEQHRINGFKTKIDFGKLAELAGSKFNGDVLKAYESSVEPERKTKDENDFKARVDAEVAKKIKEERLKNNGMFPAGAEGNASSSDFGIRKRHMPKDDNPDARRAELLRVAAAGKYNPDEDAA